MKPQLRVTDFNRNFPRSVAGGLARGLVRIFMRLAHPITTVGLENIPARGGAVLVANHVSAADMFIIAASVKRPVRIVVSDEPRGIMRLFLKSQGAIALKPRDAAYTEAAVKEVKGSVGRGELAVIFPEGTISRTGFLQPFSKTLIEVLDCIGAPMLPAFIDPPRGGPLGVRNSGVGWRSSPVFRAPSTICFGRLLPGHSPPFAARNAIQDLSMVSWSARKRGMVPLDRSFIRNARRHPFRFAMADAKVAGLSYIAALIKAVFLARRLRRDWQGQTMVGIMLPPSVPCELVNLAALLSGRVPVNLNYTAPAEIIDSCARRCDLRTVITSRQFLERLPVHVPERAIMVEDVAARPRAGEKFAAIVKAVLLPVHLLEKSLGRARPGALEDPATVIFSSGSTGNPKGVVLTHFNIASNVEQVSRVFAFRADDRLLSVLPPFHSFGFTINGILPIVRGFGAVFHSNPLDAATIGSLARRHSATMLVGPPTFLQSYVRRCAPEDFATLRIVIAGAEKLPQNLVKNFEDRFGIHPLEGYGTTECAPVVSVNTFNVRSTGEAQVACKPGTIGRPLPGISVRIVDPETYQQLSTGIPGMLLVRGPNVMDGYLGLPGKTEEVMHDGWYVTGDIVSSDEDGFLTITDRLSRFSKIGGEMVPHIRIEEALQELVGAVERVFAVTAVPDEKRGEALVVFHTLEPGELESCQNRLSELGVPNLWVPRRRHFFRVETFPTLGTGKLDLRRMHELALEMVHRVAA